MKNRKSIIICGIISFLMAYLMRFVNEDITQIKMLLTFILCGIIGTYFLDMVWSMLKEKNMSDDEEE